MRFTQKKEIRYQQEQLIRKIQYQAMTISFLKEKLNQLRNKKPEILAKLEKKEDKLDDIRCSFLDLQIGMKSFQKREDLKLSILQEQKQLLNKGFLD